MAHTEDAFVLAVLSRHYIIS